MVSNGFPPNETVLVPQGAGVTTPEKKSVANMPFERIAGNGEANGEALFLCVVATSNPAPNGSTESAASENDTNATTWGLPDVGAMPVVGGVPAVLKNDARVFSPESAKREVPAITVSLTTCVTTFGMGIGG